MSQSLFGAASIPWLSHPLPAAQIIHTIRAQLARALPVVCFTCFCFAFHDINPLFGGGCGTMFVDVNGTSCCWCFVAPSLDQDFLSLLLPYSVPPLHTNHIVRIVPSALSLLPLATIPTYLEDNPFHWSSKQPFPELDLSILTLNFRFILPSTRGNVFPSKTCSKPLQVEAIRKWERHVRLDELSGTQVVGFALRKWTAKTFFVAVSKSSFRDRPTWRADALRQRQ